MDVPVSINRRVFDYDEVIIVGRCFHEVVGMSGGNKYLFPGVGGAEIPNFFHWLGAVVTNVGIIGNPHARARGGGSRGGDGVRAEKCFALVAKGRGGRDFAGTPEAAWARGGVVRPASHRVEGPVVPHHLVLRVPDVRRALGGGPRRCTSWSRCLRTAES